MTRCLVVFLWISATVLHAQTPDWKVQYDSAQRYWGNQWAKTIPFLVKAEKAALYDLGIYDENYLTILNDLGLAYAKIGDYKNAEKSLAKVITIASEGGDPQAADLQRAYLNLASIHFEQQHYKEAEELYLKVLNDATTAQELVVPALKGISALYESTDTPAAALALLNDKRFGVQTTSAEWQITRARLLRKDGRHNEAMHVLEAMRPLVTSADALRLHWLQETALNHLETGNLNQAEKELLDAQRQLNSRKPVDDAMLIGVLNNLASLYEKLGLREKALVYYQQALPLCQKVYGIKSANSLTIQSNIAGIHLGLGQTKEAIAQYQQVEQQMVTTVSESNPGYLTVLNNLGTAYRANHEAAKAKQQFDKALLLVNKHQLTETDLAATIMNNQAVLLTTLGQFKEASTLYEKAYNIRKKVYGPTSVQLSDIAGNLAVVYWELGEQNKALPLFSQASELALRQVKYIFPNLSESEQVQFYRRMKEDFERFNSIAFRASTRNPELLTQVFNNQVTLKSLRFFTQRHRSDIIEQKRDTVLARQANLLRQKREQLGYLYQLSLGELSQSSVSTAQLEQEIDALQKNISLKTSETVASNLQDKQAAWSDVQSHMPGDEALVEIVRYRKYDLRRLLTESGMRAMFGFTDSVYYAALITTQETKANPKLVLMKDGRNMEGRNLSYYRNALTYVVADELSYNVYWKDISTALRDKKKVYFSSDGVYHQINLNTIREPGSNLFIADRHEIHYLLSPAQYVGQQTKLLQGKRAVLFGDPSFDGTATATAKTRNAVRYLPLPGTRAEVQSIDGLLKGKGWSTMVKMNDQASEQNLKAVRATDILHVATHGYFTVRNINPGNEFQKDLAFNNGLMLAGANKSLQQETTEFSDDGILTAYEVTNLDLAGTSLVVLSACETGLGNIEIGEGVYGLQRSFLQAGAKNVMISLWKVDDNITRELMTQFYTYLMTTSNIHEALANAQRDVRKKYSDPSAWGGFILIGK
ncbi:CHAT domain-containing tetratricopeptide repeat protein [Chryseolinea sp. T2]|uniref:CHAT domain-containing tetratricopeptide repeat protein n=1 Tax=Chryseolinea sp. T2 TaxID=3129255 RepID=UPI003076887F